VLLEQLHTAKITYLDREGTTGTLTIYFPSSTDLQSLIDAIMTDSRYQAVSDCTISARTVVSTTLVLDGPQPIALNGDAGVLTFDAGDTAGVAITIPGLKPELAVTEGCLAFRQVDITNAAITALADIIIAAGVIAPDGSPVLTLCSGHYAKVFYPTDRASG